MPPEMAARGVASKRCAAPSGEGSLAMTGGRTGGSANQITSTKNGDILPNLVKCFLHIAASLWWPRTTTTTL
jgi:hypothetical protein